MSLENVIRNIIRKSLIENKQLADKIYFNTNKLNGEQKDLILSVTSGDNYTKIISDILHYNPRLNKIKLNDYYNSLKSYNKNVFPISGFNDINNVSNIADLMMSLDLRKKILSELKLLPSVAIRNLKNDIRLERDLSDFSRYVDRLQYFTSHISLIGNKPENVKEKIYGKLFKNNRTIEQLIDFVEEKNNLISDVDVTKEEIIQLANEDEDMRLLHNINNVLVVEISSPEAIKEIGCNSLWCFTYGDNNERTFYDYSTNGIVYIIFDFNSNPSDEEFMWTLIKPLKFIPDKYTDKQQLMLNFDDNFDIDEYQESNDDKLFNQLNEPAYNALSVIEHLIGIETAKKIFTFEYEDYMDENKTPQIALESVIRKIIKEAVNDSIKQEAIDFLELVRKRLRYRYKTPEIEINRTINAYIRLIEKYDIKTVKELFFDKYNKTATSSNTDKSGKNQLNPEFFTGKDSGWIENMQNKFNNHIQNNKKEKVRLDDPIMREGLSTKNKLIRLNIEHMLFEFFTSKKQLL